MEKISLFISILLIGTIALLPLTKTKAQQTTTEQTFSRVNISGEGIATDPQIMFLRETDGKTYIITRVDQKVTEMYVNGQKITEDHFADYTGLLKKIDAQIAVDIAQAKLDAEQAQRDSEQAQLDAIQAGKDSEQAIRDAEQALRDAKQAELDAAQGRRDAAQADTDREQARRDADQAMRDAEQARRDAEVSVREAYNDREQSKRDAEQAQRDTDQAKQDTEQAKRDSEIAQRDMEQAKRDSEIAQRDMEQAKRDSEDDRMMQKNMTAMAAEMVTDQIVSNTKSIDSFALTDTEFVVNGKKQHEIVHQKYKDKYLKKNGYGIYYGNSQHYGTGYFYAKKKGGL